MSFSVSSRSSLSSTGATEVRPERADISPKRYELKLQEERFQSHLKAKMEDPHFGVTSDRPEESAYLIELMAKVERHREALEGLAMVQSEYLSNSTSPSIKESYDWQTLCAGFTEPSAKELRLLSVYKLFVEKANALNIAQNEKFWSVDVDALITFCGISEDRS